MLDKVDRALEQLQQQKSQLLPHVFDSEKAGIVAKAIEDIRDAYARTEAERTTSFADERGRVITTTAGVDVMPQTAAERRALESQWAAEIPATIAALPFIDSIEELLDAADVALVRQHAVAIKTLVPMIMRGLGESTDPRAETARNDLAAKLADWRKVHPTHRARAAAVEAREAAIRNGLQRSRDLLLQAHGWSAPHGMRL